MITFSPLFILVPFGTYLFIHTLFGLINMGHIFKTGATSTTSFIVTFAFLFYSIVVIGATLQIAGPIELSTPITINFSAFSSTNPF